MALSSPRAYFTERLFHHYLGAWNSLLKMYQNRRTNNCAKDVEIDSCLKLNVTGDSAWFVHLFGQNCWFTVYPK